MYMRRGEIGSFHNGVLRRPFREHRDCECIMPGRIKALHGNIPSPGLSEEDASQETLPTPLSALVTCEEWMLLAR